MTNIQKKLKASFEYNEATDIVELNKAKGKVAPFSNGSQYIDWVYRNCDTCKFYSEDIKKNCKYENELSLACFTDGKIKDSSIDIIFGKDGNCINLKK